MTRLRNLQENLVPSGFDCAQPSKGASFDSAQLAAQVFICKSLRILALIPLTFSLSQAGIT
jgi:hypothetical protein